MDELSSWKKGEAENVITFTSRSTMIPDDLDMLCIPVDDNTLALRVF